MRIALIFLAFAVTTANAQWTMQRSNTTADLRGIHNVGNGVAWASGTHGTVLRTEDGGYVWQTCTIPPGAEKLDFRGIQAFDANTAIVMSSGPGDQSRLYKTTDGCATWKLVLNNPDEEGFWDALHQTGNKTLNVLGDPVDGKFVMLVSEDRGDTWLTMVEPGREAPIKMGAFAASNSSLQYADPFMYFATGAGLNTAPRVYRTHAHCGPRPEKPKASPLDCLVDWTATDVPLGMGGSTSGVFSLAVHDNGYGKNGIPHVTIVAVGGTYDKPAQSDGTSMTSEDGGQHWTASSIPPHGYRSAVAYDSNSKTWITVGPNGTDISTDDGRNWRALKPTSTDAPDADKNWNALSLPYVVGPKGRIGKLTTTALKP